jgi:hypothetical protein
MCAARRSGGPDQLRLRARVQRARRVLIGLVQLARRVLIRLGLPPISNSLVTPREDHRSPFAFRSSASCRAFPIPRAPPSREAGRSRCRGSPRLSAALDPTSPALRPMGAVFRPADLNLYFAADLPRIVAVPTAERKVEVLRTSLPFPPVVGDAESEFPVRPQAAGKGIDQRHRCTELLARRSTSSFKKGTSRPASNAVKATPTTTSATPRLQLRLRVAPTLPLGAYAPSRANNSGPTTRYSYVATIPRSRCQAPRKPQRTANPRGVSDIRTCRGQSARPDRCCPDRPSRILVCGHGRCCRLSSAARRRLDSGYAE